MEINRNSLAKMICDSIASNRVALDKQFTESRNAIGYFFLDDLLPEDITKRIFEAFPKPDEMILKNTIRERKYIAVQMDQYDPLLEEIIYAFQHPDVIALVAGICKISNVIPDESLYAGGISMMGDGHYLNPHLDNSHDKDRKHWRVLNLLFYVAPEWTLESGGNLELWPDGVNGEPVTIVSKFNRFAVMATHSGSLHSVSPVVTDKFRCCVSNYYFSENPLREADRFHVTSFRGRPGNKLSDVLLRTDAWLRMNIRRVFSKGIVENPHVYKKKKND